jgi:hypothetical protein
MVMVDPLAIVAGPSSFVTLYVVSVAPNAAGDTVVFTVETDQAVRLSVVMKRNGATTSQVVNEAGAASGRRTITFAITTLGGPVVGEHLLWEISSLTAPPPTLRTVQNGSVRMPNARTTTNGKAVPVRWNQFGDGTRPTNGGGNPARSMEGSGNWSSYTWTQYNPKGTTYPTP